MQIRATELTVAYYTPAMKFTAKILIRADLKYIAVRCCGRTDEQDSGIISDRGYWRVPVNAEVQLTRKSP